MRTIERMYEPKPTILPLGLQKFHLQTKKLHVVLKEAKNARQQSDSSVTSNLNKLVVTARPLAPRGKPSSKHPRLQSSFSISQKYSYAPSLQNLYSQLRPQSQLQSVQSSQFRPKSEGFHQIKLATDFVPQMLRKAAQKEAVRKELKAKQLFSDKPRTRHAVMKYMSVVFDGDVRMAVLENKIASGGK